MDAPVFSSFLTAAYRGDLEELLFFNANQEDHSSAINDVIEMYGTPTIVNDNGSLRVVVGSLPDLQALFAFQGTGTRRLIGVVVFVRNDPRTLTVLHIAVQEEYSSTGLHADEMLTVRLIGKVMEAASRIKGVECVNLMYQAGSAKEIPVRRRSHTEQVRKQPSKR